MPKQYDNFGVQMLFPDNWKVDEESESASVSFESPEGAFLTITRLDDYEPGNAVRQVKEAMHDEYDEIEETAVVKRVGENELHGWHQSWVYLDLIVTAYVLEAETEQGQFLVQYQAEDRDFSRLETVFDAMLTCLFQPPSLPDNEASSRAD
ncbi:MAG: hypothetical protein AB8B50_06750 [Pirellulaceae bacterium]